MLPLPTPCTKVTEELSVTTPTECTGLASPFLGHKQRTRRGKPTAIDKRDQRSHLG